MYHYARWKSEDSFEGSLLFPLWVQEIRLRPSSLGDECLYSLCQFLAQMVTIFNNSDPYRCFRYHVRYHISVPSDILLTGFFLISHDVVPTETPALPDTGSRLQTLQFLPTSEYLVNDGVGENGQKVGGRGGRRNSFLSFLMICNSGHGCSINDCSSCPAIT